MTRNSDSPVAVKLTACAAVAFALWQKAEAASRAACAGDIAETDALAEFLDLVPLVLPVVKDARRSGLGAFNLALAKRGKAAKGKKGHTRHE